jgi:hypothetical protein
VRDRLGVDPRRIGPEGRRVRGQPVTLVTQRGSATPLLGCDDRQPLGSVVKEPHRLPARRQICLHVSERSGLGERVDGTPGRCHALACLSAEPERLLALTFRGVELPVAGPFPAPLGRCRVVERAAGRARLAVFEEPREAAGQAFAPRHAHRVRTRRRARCRHARRGERGVEPLQLCERCRSPRCHVALALQRAQRSGVRVERGSIGPQGLHLFGHDIDRLLLDIELQRALGKLDPTLLQRPLPVPE